MGLSGWHKTLHPYLNPMFTQMDFTTEDLLAFLRHDYGLPFNQADFLPSGADSDAAIFQLGGESGRLYFLKLRRGAFTEISVILPRFLHEQGVGEVIAAIPTLDGRLWTQWKAYHLVLYPFIEGQDGFETELRKQDWIWLGEAIRRIHDLDLPSDIRRHFPAETYKSSSCQSVQAYQPLIWNHQSGESVPGGSYASQLVNLLRTQWETVQGLIVRTEHLGDSLMHKTMPAVLCHSDLHAGNVLVGGDPGVVIVDWEAPLLAPKERDLMFMGAGVGGVWNQPEETAWFFQGYGQVEIDLLALAYYRCERIVADIAEYLDFFFQPGSENEPAEDEQEEALEQLRDQFTPHNVVAIAQETYQLWDAGSG